MKRARVLVMTAALLLACTKQQAKSADDIAKEIACAIANAELPDNAILQRCDTVWSVIVDPLFAHRRKLAAMRAEVGACKGEHP